MLRVMLFPFRESMADGDIIPILYHLYGINHKRNAAFVSVTNATLQQIQQIAVAFILHLFAGHEA